MLANHKVQAQVPADDAIEEKLEEMTRWVLVWLCPTFQDFDFLAMKHNALYSISLGSTSTLTKQLIDFFLLEQFFFQKNLKFS
jgi:hypothetical protein